MRFACMVVILLFAGYVFGQSKPPEACTLITEQDVAKVVGAGFKLMSSKGTSNDNSDCAYSRNQANIVNLMVVGTGSPSLTAAQALGQMQANYEKNGYKVTPVSGAGENAFSSEIGGLKTVRFGKANWHCMVNVTVKGKPDLDAAQKLAAIAYTRLP